MSISYVLSFPREVHAADVQAALLALTGLGTTEVQRPLRLIVTGSPSGISHHLAVNGEPGRLVRQLSGAVPGLTFQASAVPQPVLPIHAWRLWQSSGRRPFASDRPEQVARALLVVLSQPLGSNEAISLTWLLGPVRRPTVVGSRPQSMLSESWARALLTAAFRSPGDLDADARRALRAKREHAGWRAVAFISVTTDRRARGRQLAGEVLAALRVAEAAGVRLGVRRVGSAALQRTPWRWNLYANISELSGLLGWPLGASAAGLPVLQRSSVLLGVPSSVPTSGRVLARAPQGGRNIHLGRPESLQHLHLMGPTGTGKSTLLTSLILQDIQAGYSVIALDPKGGLVDDVLRRYPDHRRGDLVVLDPSDPSPVGFNPLAAPGDPALIADQLLGIFSRLYADSWGPRTADVLQASLLTLARSRGSSLAFLPLLLTNASYRRSLVGRLDDPLGLGPFWAWFESLSEAERQQVIAPTLNKVRPFLLRPDLRSVIGQAEPRFDLRDVFLKPRVLLVNLAKGSLGPEGSGLLGTVLLNQLWQTTLARASLSPDKLRPVYLYVDEMQDFLRLPGDIGELLAQARGLKLGFTLAHQHLGQLSPDLRAAVLANARSRVLFQLEQADAAFMARGHPELTPLDLSALGAYEVFLSLQASGTVTPYMSGVTLPPTPATGDPETLRAISRTQYGRPRAEVEAALRAAVGQDQGAGAGPIGSRPRRST